MKQLKKLMALSGGCLLLAGLSGCCNIAAHTNDGYPFPSFPKAESTGIYRGTRAFYPELVRVLIGPFLPGTCAYVPIYGAILGIPVCSVMVSLEIVADTVTFPYDSWESIMGTQNEETVPSSSPTTKQAVEP